MLERYIVLVVDPRRAPRDQLEWYAVTATGKTDVERAMLDIRPLGTAYVFGEKDFAMIAESLIYQVSPDFTIEGTRYLDHRDIRKVTSR